MNGIADVLASRRRRISSDMARGVRRVNAAKLRRYKVRNPCANPLRLRSSSVSVANSCAVARRVLRKASDAGTRSRGGGNEGERAH